MLFEHDPAVITTGGFWVSIVTGAGMHGGWFGVAECSASMTQLPTPTTAGLCPVGAGDGHND